MFLMMILGIMLFPWQSICLAHPFGHIPHKHNGPSPCELRRQYDGTQLVVWPPMECKHISAKTDDFQKPDKTSPNIEIQFIRAPQLKNLPVAWNLTIHSSLPDVGSNSDPPFNIQSYRGPPISFCV
jgi:hypothetical protein